MRKFRFGLQRVLDYRQTVEDRLLGELAAIRIEHEIEVSKLQSLADKRLAFTDRIRRGAVAGDAEGLKRARQYLAALGDCIAEQVDAVRQAADLVDRKLVEVIEASRDRKTLDRLRDYKKAEHVIEAQRQEQKTLDDIAATRHVSGRSSSDRMIGDLT